MKPFRVLFVVLAVLALALPVLAAEDGAALYKSKCAGCHAADGTGSPMGKKLGVKPLGGADVQKLTDAEIEKVITTGKGKMPPVKTLNAEQVKAVVGVIRSFKK